MLRLAVNYSNPLIQLLKQRHIQVDLIKCPDWEGMLTEAEPYGEVTIHFDLDTGLGKTFEVDLERIKALKEKTFTPHVNTHLVAPRTFHPDNSEERREINRLWRQELQVLIKKFGANSVALEHFPYTDNTPYLKAAIEPQSFSKVIEDTGCMFLLDLAHARITAETLKIDVREYIRELPIDRLVEMHITGIKHHSGILTDHFGMGEKDWKLFKWALGEIRSGVWPEPRLIAFEYGGVGNTFVWRTELEVLKSQVPKLYNLIHSQD